MKRKAILFGGALAGFLVAFAIYWAVFQKGSTTEASQQTPPPLTDHAKGDGAAIGEGMVYAGEGAEFPLYDTVEQTDARGRVQTVTRNIGFVRIAHHKPLGRGQFQLTRPQFWLHFKDNQTLYLESDTAIVEASEGAEVGSMNPRRGTLIGNVRLLLDRQTDEQLKKTSPLKRPRDTVVIEFNEDRDKDGIDDAEVEFDYPDNLIQSASKMTMISHEWNIRDAHGLKLRWDMVSRQITQLRLNTRSELAGGDRLPPARMLLRQDELMNMGGDKDEPSQTAASGSERPSAAASADATPEEVQTYIAKFHRKVQIVQGWSGTLEEFERGSDGNKMKFDGKLFCDNVVQLIFDFNPPESDDGDTAIGRTETADASATPAADPAPEPEPAFAPAADEPLVLVEWEGVLDMVPYEQLDEADRLLRGLRRELIAIGSGAPGVPNVVLIQGDGRSAICRKLHYDTRTGKARMVGDVLTDADRKAGRKPNMVVLTQPDGQKIEAEQIVFDQKNNRAQLIGAGTMMARSGGVNGQPAAELNPGGTVGDLNRDDPDVMRIEWQDHVEVGMGGGPFRLVQLGPDRKATTRPDSDGTGFKKDRDFIREATFSGKVKMSQLGQYEIEANTITVYFHQPSDTVQPNQIDYVQAVGTKNPRSDKFDTQVHIIQGDNEIYCDHLTLEMKLMPDGTTVPDKAKAMGNVSGKQGPMQVQSDMVEMQFGPKAAGSAADGQRTENDRYNYEAKEIQAFGSVIVSDPSRQLDASGDHLYTMIGSQKATLTGQPAKIAMGERRMTGAIIELNQQTQYARVLGAGDLAFRSDSDLTGAPVAGGTRVTARWTLGMSFDAGNDVAELRGNVRAVSGRSQLQAELLRLHFKDKPKEPDRQAAAPAAIAAPAAVAATTGSSVEQPVVAATAAAPSTQPDEPLVDFQGKTLANLVAERNVNAVTSTVDEKTGRLLTRFNIVAQQLLFNADTSQVDAVGNGQMLLEDYRDPPEKPRAEPVPVNRAQPRPVRPSRTAFEWSRSMKANPQVQVVSFSGDVVMVHVGPDALTVGPGGQVVMDRKAPRTRLTCENLLVEFQSDPNAPVGDGGVVAQGDRVRDIRGLRATEKVELKQGTRSLTGDYVEYVKATDIMTVRGSKAQPARLFDLGPGGNTFAGREIVWNRTTGDIDVEDAAFTGAGG